jgi:hypothetical protein
MDDQYALAWFCIDTLVLAICSFSEQEGAEERVHRLHLALISTISSLPLPLLPLALNEVRDIVGSGGGEKKQELVDALFGEILERVGDREKEIVLGWWLRSPAMSHL